MEPITYRVRRAEDQSLLVDFVAKRLSISKRAAKAILDRRNIAVNGTRVWMARHALNVGDEVRILAPPTSEPKRDIPVLYRDDNLVVVNKPTGKLACGKNSMEEILRRQLRAKDLQAVHRLDRDTSGCLMFAFSETARQRMIDVFRAKAVTKIYHAIVHGHMTKGNRRISKPLGGQTAVSNVRVLDCSRRASHVSVNIETGRTHQIRIHLAAVRHPVLGDRKYAGGVRLENTLTEVPRQMLHAYALSFEHPVTGKPTYIKASLPPDFKACLKAFKLT
jgi:RluA family pseudouridine synthase